ncbi:fucolectin isoform X4 [Anolis carolinensis]|uniref:fucolectin isoform X4 n=1 Tax=Anolis carolinensis TaxID=28377 RepID=UPI00046280FF|nr:PREDICTED: fucolectin-like [Anolis carolinensis]|eukprot:XP_008123629.1 PREDICTED: fucolectin-like [Anolis carolinensis]
MGSRRMFFVSWTGLLGLALLVSRGEGQSCLPGVQVVPNLARGRPAFQSSTYQHPKSLVAGKAVDGNCNGNLDGAGSCTHTNGDMEPWWYVDLGDEYAIFAVVIKNRGECCGDRIRGAEIHVGDFVAENSKFNPLCGTIADTSLGSISTIHCNGLRGRFVSVNIPNRNDALTLCEVEVYGMKVEDRCR